MCVFEDVTVVSKPQWKDVLPGGHKDETALRKLTHLWPLRHTQSAPNHSSCDSSLSSHCPWKDVCVHRFLWTHTQSSQSAHTLLKTSLNLFILYFCFLKRTVYISHHHTHFHVLLVWIMHLSLFSLQLHWKTTGAFKIQRGTIKKHRKSGSYESDSKSSEVMWQRCVKDRPKWSCSSLIIFPCSELLC